MATIITVREGRRGCGWRKPGGLYLMSGTLQKSCGKLPRLLQRCPCCDQGIKPSRGFTWIGAAKLFEKMICHGGNKCIGCPLHTPPERAGLLWIGEKFYKTAVHYMQEARDMGVSRRLRMIPHHFKVGETVVLLAHRRAIHSSERDGQGNETEIWFPAIFSAFVPQRIEYVVKGTETEEELDKLEKRGFTLVKIERDESKPKPRRKPTPKPEPAPDQDEDDPEPKPEGKKVRVVRMQLSRRVDLSDAPKHFQGPAIDNLVAGDFCKLSFGKTTVYADDSETTEADVERMWVRITKRKPHAMFFHGILDNDPTILTHLHAGKQVVFNRKRIIDTMKGGE